MASSNDFVTESPIQGKLLISTPRLNGSCFEKSLIYVCRHNEEGAMGLVLNQTIPTKKSHSILSQLNIDDDFCLLSSINLHLGGPVDVFRGFILHSDDYRTSGTSILDAGYALSCSVDALRDVISGKGPSKSIVALGYAGWEAGQLEAEIHDDSWLCLNASEELIFHTHYSDKWYKATQYLGVSNMLHYSAVAGNA
jgi:putative transcriptional regulator